MLYTGLNHIETADELAKVLNDDENVTIVCGRMGPMCISVYRIAEEIEDQYGHVKFFDMEFDNPESNVIRSLPEVNSFMSIPFTLYFKNGKVVQATSGIQTKAQVTSILDHVFAINA